MGNKEIQHFYKGNSQKFFGNMGEFENFSRKHGTQTSWGLFLVVLKVS